MLLALGDISSGNLAYGALRYSQLTAAEAAERLSAALEAGDVMGLYDFGATPNARRERHFTELLTALQDVLGVTVPREAFFFSVDTEEGGLTSPIPQNLASMRSDRPILLVRYSLEMDTEARAAQAKSASTRHRLAGGITASGAGRETAEAVIERMFPTKISAQSLEFSWLEMIEVQ